MPSNGTKVYIIPLNSSWIESCLSHLQFCSSLFVVKLNVFQSLCFPTSLPAIVVFPLPGILFLHHVLPFHLNNSYAPFGTWFKPYLPRLGEDPFLTSLCGTLYFSFYNIL